MKYHCRLFILAVLNLPLGLAWADGGPQCAGVFIESTGDISVSAPVAGARRLYENGAITNDYNAILESLKPGDVLDFGDGDVVTVERLIGHGSTSYVVRVREGGLLRIPIALHESIFGRSDDLSTGGSLLEFNRIQSQMERDGVPVVRVDRLRSRLPKFLVVEERRFRFSLAKLFEKGGEAIPKAERKEALAKLEIFAKKAWAYTTFGDWRPDQIAYDGTEWVVFDMRRIYEKISFFDDPETILSTVKGEDDFGEYTVQFLPDDLVKDFEKVIRKERRRQQESGTWLERRNFRLMTGPILTESILRLEKLEGREYDFGRHTNNHKFHVGRLLKQHKKSALFEVVLDTGAKGLLEVAIDVDLASEPKERFRLSKNDRPDDLRLFFRGEDFQLFLPKHAAD